MAQESDSSGWPLIVGLLAVPTFAVLLAIGVPKGKDRVAPLAERVKVEAEVQRRLAARRQDLRTEVARDRKTTRLRADLTEAQERVKALAAELAQLAPKGA